jgi:hypothetical protein
MSHPSLARSLEMVGIAPWRRQYGERPFIGPQVPLGALVDFKPPPTRPSAPTFAPRGVPGVLLGCSKRPGDPQKGESLVALLADFEAGTSADNASVASLLKAAQERRRRESRPKGLDKARGAPEPYIWARKLGGEAGGEPELPAAMPESRGDAGALSPAYPDDPPYPSEGAGGRTSCPIGRGDMNDPADSPHSGVFMTPCGFVDAGGRYVREWKGRKCPPHLWPEVWVSPAPAHKLKAQGEWRAKLHPRTPPDFGAALPTSTAVPSPDEHCGIYSRVLADLAGVVHPEFPPSACATQPVSKKTVCGTPADEQALKNERSTLRPGGPSRKFKARPACIQLKLDGFGPAWARVPRDRRPEAVAGGRAPVCPSVLALCGHPDVGGHRERHCERHPRRMGFMPIPEWSSCPPQLFPVVHVDDFIVAHPSTTMDRGWSLVHTCPTAERPQPVRTHPGCVHDSLKRASSQDVARTRHLALPRRSTPAVVRGASVGSYSVGSLVHGGGGARAFGLRTKAIPAARRFSHSAGEGAGAFDPRIKARPAARRRTSRTVADAFEPGIMSAVVRRHACFLIGLVLKWPLSGASAKGAAITVAPTPREVHAVAWRAAPAKGAAINVVPAPAEVRNRPRPRTEESCCGPDRLKGCPNQCTKQYVTVRPTEAGNVSLPYGIQLAYEPNAGHNTPLDGIKPGGGTIGRQHCHEALAARRPFKQVAERTYECRRRAATERPNGCPHRRWECVLCYMHGRLPRHAHVKVHASEFISEHSNSRSRKLCCTCSHHPSRQEGLCVRGGQGRHGVAVPRTNAVSAPKEVHAVAWRNASAQGTASKAIPAPTERLCVAVLRHAHLAAPAPVFSTGSGAHGAFSPHPCVTGPAHVSGPGCAGRSGPLRAPVDETTDVGGGCPPHMPVEACVGRAQPRQPRRALVARKCCMAGCATRCAGETDIVVTRLGWCAGHTLGPGRPVCCDSRRAIPGANSVPLASGGASTLAPRRAHASSSACPTMHDLTACPECNLGYACRRHCAALPTGVIRGLLSHAAPATTAGQLAVADSCAPPPPLWLGATRPPVPAAPVRALLDRQRPDPMQVDQGGVGGAASEAAPPVAEIDDVTVGKARDDTDEAADFFALVYVVLMLYEGADLKNIRDGVVQAMSVVTATITEELSGDSEPAEPVAATATPRPSLTRGTPVKAIPMHAAALARPVEAPARALPVRRARGGPRPREAQPRPFVPVAKAPPAAVPHVAVTATATRPKCIRELSVSLHVCAHCWHLLHPLVNTAVRPECLPAELLEATVEEIDRYVRSLFEARAVSENAARRPWEAAELYQDPLLRVQVAMPDEFPRVLWYVTSRDPVPCCLSMQPPSARLLRGAHVEACNLLAQQQGADAAAVARAAAGRTPRDTHSVLDVRACLPNEDKVWHAPVYQLMVDKCGPLRPVLANDQPYLRLYARTRTLEPYPTPKCTTATPAVTVPLAAHTAAATEAAPQEELAPEAPAEAPRPWQGDTPGAAAPIPTRSGGAVIGRVLAGVGAPTQWGATAWADTAQPQPHQQPPTPPASQPVAWRPPMVERCGSVKPVLDAKARTVEPYPTPKWTTQPAAPTAVAAPAVTMQPAASTTAAAPTGGSTETPLPWQGDTPGAASSGGAATLSPPQGWWGGGWWGSSSGWGWAPTHWSSSAWAHTAQPRPQPRPQPAFPVYQPPAWQPPADISAPPPGQGWMRSPETERWYLMFAPPPTHPPQGP